MFKENILLKEYTTLKVGGPAEYFAVVKTEEELVETVKKARAQGLEMYILGGGSNMFVSDKGLSGLVIKNEIRGISEEVNGDVVLVTVGGGEVFDQAVAYTVEKEYWGLENLSHIPGSTGATPVQNVGAYGVEVEDLITEVRIFNIETLLFETFSNSQCQFGYRNSFFKTKEGKKYIVVSVTYKLSVTPSPNLEYRDLAAYFKNNDKPQITEVRDAVISIRSKKFPDWAKVGTAGSFFKNPIISKVQFEALKETYPDMPGFPATDSELKVPLGWILDKVCDVRGLTQGNVGSYEGQALVLVNNGSATSEEVEVFAKNISDVVLQKTNIAIEWEVTRMK